MPGGSCHHWRCRAWAPPYIQLKHTVHSKLIPGQLTSCFPGDFLGPTGLSVVDSMSQRWPATVPRSWVFSGTLISLGHLPATIPLVQIYTNSQPLGLFVTPACSVDYRGAAFSGLWCGFITEFHFSLDGQGVPISPESVPASQASRVRGSRGGRRIKKLLGGGVVCG